MMKKIISIIAVLAIVFSFSVTAFAATATMTVAPVTVDVADGTQNVTMNIVFTMSEATVLYGAQIEFVLPAGVTLTAVDWSELEAICPDGVDLVNNLTVGKTSCFEAMAAGTNAAVETLTVPCTLSVDTTTAQEYSISFTANTGILDADSFDYINSGVPSTTITVAAAGPVAVADTKKFDATFDASDIEIDGVKYQNVAVINGSATAPVLEDGESITKVGIEYDGAEVRDLTSVSGGGNVTYKVLFYGITDEEAEALAAKVKTFYTGMFFPAN